MAFSLIGRFARYSPAYYLQFLCHPLAPNDFENQGGPTLYQGGWGRSCQTLDNYSPIYAMRETQAVSAKKIDGLFF